MRLYRRKQSPFYYADLRSKGFKQFSTGKSDLEDAKQVVYNFLTIKGTTPKSPTITLSELIARYKVLTPRIGPS